MSLDLDGRRRAMLEEIGVKLFAPDSAPVRDVATPPTPARHAGAAPLPPSAAPAAAVAVRPAIAVDAMQLDALAGAVANCHACKLCESRTQTVFGVGDTQPEWLIVGEAPGEDEDLQGEPFAGQAGQLLDNMLKAIGLDRRSKVYIANALKCRPPGTRNPEPQEVAQCEPFLRRQVELLRPRVILAMGRFAAQALLASAEPIGKLRGRPHRYLGVPVVVTYPPAYLLRNLPDKAKAWSDLCLALELMRDPAAQRPSP